MRNKYENIKIIKRLVKNTYDNYESFEKIFDGQIIVFKINKDSGKFPPPPPTKMAFSVISLSLLLCALRYFSRALEMMGL